MLQTLAVTGPIYIVIALGFVAGQFGVFSKPDMRVLGTFVVRFALPALVFTALSQRPVSEILNLRYMLDYAIGSLFVMLVAFAWGWWQQGKSFEGAKVRDQLEAISGFQGTTGVYNMSPTVHQGITVNPFLLASIIGGRVIVVK